MSHWPVRTGIKSVKRLLHKVCQLLAKYRTTLQTILTSGQMEKVDALIVACEAFINDIPSDEPA